MLRQYYLRFYPKTIAVILILTALLKIVGSFSRAPLLSTHDPLLIFTTERTVLILGAFAEIVCATALASFPAASGLWIATWLVLIFGIYRIGLHVLGASSHICPCLGYWLPLKPEIENRIALALLYIMLLGNACGLILCYRAWIPSVRNLLRK